VLASNLFTYPNEAYRKAMAIINPVTRNAREGTAEISKLNNPDMLGNSITIRVA